MMRIAVTGFNKGLFPFTHNCAASIAVGAKCTILVRRAEVARPEEGGIAGRGRRKSDP